MAPFRYPVREIDRPLRLAELCGSLWGSLYADDAALLGYLGGYGRLIRQADRNLLEARQGLDRFASPLSHVELWRFWQFSESTITQSIEALPQYGEGFLYGDPAAAIFYGEPISRPTFCLPLPAGVNSAPLVHNRFSYPTISWLEGIDYVVDPQRRILKLNVNPFTHPYSVIEEIYQGNKPVDQQVTIWAQNARMRTNLIQEQHGYIWQLFGDATESYRRLVNAVWDAAVEGSTLRIIQEVLGAIFDEPTALDPEETVEDVWLQPDALVIATDKHVYRCSPAATSRVEAGDVVGRGEYLTTTIRIDEINDGVLPGDLDWLPIETRFLSPGYTGSLLFQNADTPWIVETVGEQLRASFSVGGSVADIARFWDDVAAKGVAGRTLAQLMTGSDEPRDGQLPVSVNPAQFLIENLLRNNLFLVRMSLLTRGPEALPLVQLSWLREVLPPHVAAVVILEASLGTAEYPDLPIADADPSDFIEDTAVYTGTIMAEAVVGYAAELCV